MLLNLLSNSNPLYFLKFRERLLVVMRISFNNASVVKYDLVIKGNRAILIIKPYY